VATVIQKVNSKAQHPHGPQAWKPISRRDARPRQFGGSFR
jgi:hypothetical protein